MQRIRFPSAKLPRWLIVTVALCLVVLIGFVDWLTGTEVSLSVFYLLPVALTVWYAGTIEGVFVVLFSGLAWLVAALVSTNFSEPWIPYFNACIRTAVFAIVAWLVTRMKDLTVGLESRVRQRTAELEREITRREWVESQLRESEGRFRQMTDSITQVFWMTDPQKAQMLYVSPAYEQIWGRTCESLYRSPRSWLESIHPDDQQRIEHAALMRQTSGEYDEEYRVVKPNGQIRWVRDRAFPIRNEAGAVYRIAGIAEDITDRRKLEREILEISDREQARIGQDLHDGVCQALVGIAFAVNLHEKKLTEQSSLESAGAHEILVLLNDTIAQCRNVARGLHLVKMDAAGLASALQELASMLAKRFKITCQFEQPTAVGLNDTVINTHLYRIAQEAVMNSIKHGKARRIAIALSAAGEDIRLTVTDDGVGMPETIASRGGLGLHIMRYRASLIGGALTLRRGAKGGTIVEYAFRHRASEVAGSNEQ